MSHKSLLSSLVLLGTLVTVAGGAIPALADSTTIKTSPENLELVPVPDTAINFNPIPALFSRAFYNETGRFYDFTTIAGQANTLFGWRTFLQGSYFDNMVTREAKLVETLYYDVMQAQQAGPVVRTADIPNPYDTSLLENPSYLSPGGY